MTAQGRHPEPGLEESQRKAGTMSSEGGQELVVVGVDGSAESVAALNWAARYASATGARVQALLAWHYPGAVGGPAVERAPESVRAQTEEHMRATLDEAIAKSDFGQPGAGSEARLAYGHPAQALIDASRDADLLVVGSHGHGAFTGMMLGSVSIHCATSAFCPVVVVRRTGGPL
jgi:nucleotide-binding universal stress UspA family protein